MPNIQDGPVTSRFTALKVQGNASFDSFSSFGVSKRMVEAVKFAPSGACTAWGLPFEIGDVILLDEKEFSFELDDFTAQWLVFMHTSDLRQIETSPGEFISPMRGEGNLGEHVANYLVRFADGSEERIPIRRRYQLGTFQRRWGENCFEAVSHQKPKPVPAAHEQLNPGWGWTQTRVDVADSNQWTNWLFAWKNPHPEKVIRGFGFQPVSGLVVLFGVSAGNVGSTPLRWKSRQKAVLTLQNKEGFKPELDERGCLAQIQLDMGQVISATHRLVYPNLAWSATYNNQLPAYADNEILVEYTAHPEACFHLGDGKEIPIAEVLSKDAAGTIRPAAPQKHRVTLRVLDGESGKPVAVKLHLHGEDGEYLAPVDRHRIPNPAWFEDYSSDFVHNGQWDGSINTPHYCTYIPGDTQVDLPPGKVYLEISKGFEIRPIRKVIEVTPDQTEIVTTIEKVLPWREQGWVTADTHVHFLSPMTALLEGAAEGVNVVNLLASQWGELMTNVGDFDGKNTWGLKESGGDGEYLVRVGTENRQHVLGHISLLGYKGKIIAPMTSGGPDESALGDPIEILLTEWARKCKEQGGLVVLPHFPNPRGEHAASMVNGVIDAVEMTAWGNLYGGIDPYSLSDWYRYLNCGYQVPAVGGTDKMSANTAIGTVRTYTRIPEDQAFNYENWMAAIRRGETFVTYGPLLKFNVDDSPMGSRIQLNSTGGTVDVTWEAASVTIPMSRVELIINGEIRESSDVSPETGSGNWRVKTDKSCWVALLVRGHYGDQPEIITAHSSPVMITVEGSPMLAAADALTILEQIEGALVYLDSVGTRADDAAYKRMRMVLQSSHRCLHNRMHELGFYHNHISATMHPKHI